MFAKNEVVTMCISQECWDKAKFIINNLIGESMVMSETTAFQQLESYRGFLVYISRTYPVMNAYLKGTHWIHEDHGERKMGGK